MPAEDSSDSLPVHVTNARSYIRIRPTTDQLNVETVTAHLRRLHSLSNNQANPTLLDRLRGPKPSTIEVLLVSTGGDDTRIEYYLGVDDDATHDTFTRTLRGLFPDSYEFTAVHQQDGWLRGVAGLDPTLAGVEFYGKPDRPKDWQTQLSPFETFLTDDHARIPLAAIFETMAATASPMIYQALLRPKPDWTQEAESRRVSIEAQQDTWGGELSAALFGAPEEGQEHLSNEDQQRLEELAEKDARWSFECSARAVAIDDGHTIRELTSAFTNVSHTCYAVGATTRTGSRADALFDAMCKREFTSTSRLPSLRTRPKPLVVDASEAANFCIVDGDALTTAGDRALAPTPREATTLPSPPAEQLDAYRGPGLPLGQPLSDDGIADPEPVTLPPSLQPMHVGWFGKTGSGKSTALINAILANHAATDGADILIDPKGDGMAQEYLRAHYATYGHLENVLYFDCAEVLPAFSFFDIRDELDAGVPRATAVEDTVDHYLEILAQIMGRDRFEQAVRSPDIIRYLLKATFDPVNGEDAFSHRAFDRTIRRMHERQAAPPVADEDLERMLAGVVANRARSFDEIMQGVANRVEKIPIDQRLARIFNHVPEDGDPHFDLAEYLNEDVVIILDTGGLRNEAQRVLTLVVLSNLWTALRRRSQRSQGDQPLVNLYIEEAASVAVSDLLKQLLSQSRSFDCSMTLAMQFPAQLKSQNHDVYEELLNNISTFVAGNVAVDRLLARRLATDEMDAVAVGNRLRALRRGQWLVSLPAAFDSPEPRPFLVRSL
ncbi:ATP-binding protein, partial [Halolamina litorea]